MKLLLDPFRMIRDIGRQGLGIFIWGGLLNIPQVLGGLVFIATIEGQVILATVIATLVVAGQIHRRQPFSRLIGICHLPWLALLPWLVYRLADAAAIGALEIWVAYVAAVIAISLVFDALDLYRYARGDRKFSWAR